MTKAIYFDMDGTIANLYGVENWLSKLRAEDETPYLEAQPLLRLSTLAKILNNLQKNGYIIGVISWLSKNSSKNYREKVAQAKIKWLKSHLASVNFDEIILVPYGTPKEKSVKYPKGILFDDELKNRENWSGTAFDEKNILEILKAL